MAPILRDAANIRGRGSGFYFPTDIGANLGSRGLVLVIDLLIKRRRNFDSIEEYSRPGVWNLLID